QVFAALDTPTLRSLSADAKGDDAQARTLARELHALEARVEALSTAHFVDGAIGAAEYGRRRAELERRVEDLHRRLADATGQRLRIRIPKGRRAQDDGIGDCRRQALASTRLARALIASSSTITGQLRPTSASRCCDDHLNPPWQPRSEWNTTPSTAPPRVATAISERGGDQWRAE